MNKLTLNEPAKTQMSVDSEKRNIIYNFVVTRMHSSRMRTVPRYEQQAILTDLKIVFNGCLRETFF